ncbi:MAG: RimK family alpha-L-glutamate ligase [Lachnospiraceae bacterium]|nr:RimK family alpha-L-glutamate ligase [Lachnospiraceae bacterium]
MNGWLITNGFLKIPKFNDIYDRLISAASREGCELKLITNTDIIARIDKAGNLTADPAAGWPDFIIFWDKDIRLARSLEAQGLRLYNRAGAIEACDDKSLTIRLLSGLVRMPETYCIPFTYDLQGYSDTGFLDIIADRLGYPFVLKECFGSFGEQVHLINSWEESEAVLKSCGGRPCIIQEYIKGPWKGSRDIRINVVGNRCVASMMRINEDDFRANITNGGRMEPYTPTKEECGMALTVCKKLGLDFAGVDIMFDENHEPVFCEANSNAHFKSIYDCTGVDVAAEIIKHIISDRTLNGGTGNGR